MSYEKIYTDVVKDVIGNEPVIDQFDLFYIDSFYGTMQDDYVTGTMVKEIKDQNQVSKGTRAFVTGTRGKAFSSYYAELEQDDSQINYVSTDAERSGTRGLSRLSQRLRRPETQSSFSYRLLQSYDESERFFDSCLPSFANALKVNKAVLWTYTGSIKGADNIETTTPQHDVGLIFSPFGSVETGSIGYVTFNDVPIFKENNDGFEEDPSCDNVWTWSYPYENKYFPENRFKDSKEALGINKLDYAINANKSAITKLPNSLGINKFFPILPGKPCKYMPDKDFAYPAEGPIGFAGGTMGGSTNLLTININSETNELSDKLKISIFSPLGPPGYSNLIPADVDFETKKITRDYLKELPFSGTLSDIDIERLPISASLTGTMSNDDTIKFLYGFGDLNTVSYAHFSPKEDQIIFDGKLNNHNHFFMPKYNSGGTSDAARWRKSLPLSLQYPIDPYAIYKPKVVLNDTSAEIVDGYDFGNATDGGISGSLWWGINSSSYEIEYDETTMGTVGYYYVSESFNDDGSRKNYVRWVVSSSIDNNFYSSTEKNQITWGSSTGRSIVTKYGTISEKNKQFLDNLPINKSSKMFVNIKSSVPWTFSYDRAIHADPTDRFYSYWGNYPGHSGARDDVIIEQIYGSHASGTQGGTTLSPFTGSLTTLYPPGFYNLAFVYEKNSYVSGTIDRAFVNNLRFYRLKKEEEVMGSLNPYSLETLTPLGRVGGNNYPEFNAYKIDSRPNLMTGTIVSKNYATTASVGIGISVGEKTGEYYGSHVYGIGPVIRGWKYGLYSGLPMHSKGVFRRDKYGNFRDMLEQRPYTKYVFDVSENDPFINPGRPNSGIGKGDSGENTRFLGSGPGPVEISFVKARLEVDPRGVGKIRYDKVDPQETSSQNLSTYSTSSQPYFDGETRFR